MIDDTILFEMLIKRDKVYSELTSRILSKIPVVLEGIEKYFSDSFQNIEYQDITLAQDDIIVITSKPVFNKQQNRYHHLTIGLPISIINKTSSDDVYRFLLDAELAKSKHNMLEKGLHKKTKRVLH
jgi:hypothetical protein